MDGMEIRKAAAALVLAIYQDPRIPAPGELATIPKTSDERQCFRNGYYSVRDLDEFMRLVSLLKDSGDYPKTFIEMLHEMEHR